MDSVSLEDRTRLLITTEYMLAANRLTKPRPWHSGGRRWAESASSVTLAEREARLVPRYRESCPPSFWSLQRSAPAKPGLRRAKTAHAASYAERTRFTPEPYRAEPCTSGESLRQCLNNEFLHNFGAEQLRCVETSTRNTLPTQKTISDEKQAIISERSHSWRNKQDRGADSYTSPVPTRSELTDNIDRRTDTSDELHTEHVDISDNDKHNTTVTECYVCHNENIHK